MNRQGIEGFRLFDLIGIFSVISILASLVLPRALAAMHQASVGQTAVSLNTIKTACISHYAKFGELAIDGSVSPPRPVLLNGCASNSSQFDGVLVKEGLLDNPFLAKIGDGILDGKHTRIQIVAGEPPSTEPDGSNSSYDLGNTGNANDASGSVVVEAVITDVSLEDARALNAILEGSSLSENQAGCDFRGRVKYAKPGDADANVMCNGKVSPKGNNSAYSPHRSDTTDVHIYLMHR